jgi:hypothetical protein
VLRSDQARVQSVNFSGPDVVREIGPKLSEAKFPIMLQFHRAAF